MENNETLKLIISELNHELLQLADQENFKIAIVIADVAGEIVFNYTMDGVSNLTLRQCATKAKMLAMSIKEKGTAESPSFGMAEGAVPIMYHEQYYGVLSISGAKKENDVRLAKLALENINTF